MPEGPKIKPDAIKSVAGALRGRLSRAVRAIFGAGKEDVAQEETIDPGRRKFLAGAAAAAAAPAAVKVDPGKITKLAVSAARAGFSDNEVNTIVSAQSQRLFSKAERLFDLIKHGKNLRSVLHAAQTQATLLVQDPRKLFKQAKNKDVFELGALADLATLDLDLPVEEASSLIEKALKSGVLNEDEAKMYKFLAKTVKEAGYSNVKDLSLQYRKIVFNSASDFVEHLQNKLTGKQQILEEEKQMLEGIQRYFGNNYRIFRESTDKFRDLYRSIHKLYDAITLPQLALSSDTSDHNVFEALEKLHFAEGKAKLITPSYAQARSFARKNAGKAIILRALGLQDKVFIVATKDIEFAELFNKLLADSRAWYHANIKREDEASQNSSEAQAKEEGKTDDKQNKNKKSKTPGYVALEVVEPHTNFSGKKAVALRNYRA